MSPFPLALNSKLKKSKMDVKTKKRKENFEINVMTMAC